ncbi:hypothetical protein ABIB25_001863 [Nakamurella sp. UYEF19]|uniref:hypothetical protein n=1 Tax=Nakamurella sp. UYEF19 TaxID=1756392 RepID=UPI003394E1F7
MTSAAAVVVRPRASRSALGSAGLLVVGGVIVAIGGLVGVVHSYDGSPRGVATGAAWTILLPAIVALVLSAWRPVLGLAVSAGAGLIAVTRIFADLSLTTAPNSAIRPEFFYEVSDRAQPFTVAGGAAVVLVGDVLMVLAGLYAARRLSSRLSFAPDRIFDAAPDRSADLGSGPGLLAQALESAEAGSLSDVRPDGAPGDDSAPTGRSQRNNALILVGFLGVLAVLTASLGLPYGGGYLAARYLPPELDLWGIGAALAGAVVATIGVLAAAVLPRQIAVAVLGGVGIGAAVPFLTAVAVRSVGSPVTLNPTVGVGLAGAVVIAVAGLLARARLVQEDDDEPSASSVRTLNLVGAVLTLLVAAAGAAAWRLPQLHYNGGADPRLADGYRISEPLSLPFLIAGLVPLVAGVLWLVPPLARSGRAIASVAWLAMLVALTRSLDVLGQVVASASVPNGVFAPPTWSAGPGLWWGLAGVLLGVASLAVAMASGRRAADASSLVAEEDSLDGSRSMGAAVAWALTVLTVIVLALPVYRTTAGSSATLLVGFQVDSWGVLALAGGMVGAAWAGARAKWVTQAVAFPLAAGAVLVVRLVIPASVRAQDGFDIQPGLIAGYVLLVAYLAGAVLLGLSSGRIRMADPAAALTSAARTGNPKVGRTAAVKPARPVAQRSGAAPRAKPGAKKR